MAAMLNKLLKEFRLFKYKAICGREIKTLKSFGVMRKIRLFHIFLIIPCFC
jgi:hypothetical protein